MVGSSPHTRGAPSRTRKIPSQWRIIPAYAGSTVPASFVSSSGKDHPRIRGEHVIVSFADCFQRGSSPHTRGARLIRPVAGRRARIIPAYAGSTPQTVQDQSTLRDHPRIRGEHQVSGETFFEDEGSSPHTRGARQSAEWGQQKARIIPAYAGSTGCRAARPCSESDHPRIRGEHVPAVDPCCWGAGSSPHTRGAHGVTFVSGVS